MKKTKDDVLAECKAIVEAEHEPGDPDPSILVCQGEPLCDEARAQRHCGECSWCDRYTYVAVTGVWALEKARPN